MFSQRSVTGEMKRLLFMLDEGQLLAQQRDFASKILQLRHAGISLIMNAQNPSCLPVELLSNSDLISFQLVDRRDKDAFGNAVSLTREQRDHLSQLDQGCCVCFLSGVRCKGVFLGKVPSVEFSGVELDVEEQSKGFVKQFGWEGIESVKVAEVGGTQVDVDVEKFLQDVLDQRYEDSAVTKRFERCGIRSASVQGQVIRRLTSEGFIVIYALAVGVGRPWKLVEPTDKCFQKFGVSWKKTRGVLPTRIATKLLRRNFEKLDGWNVVLEGRLEKDGKQIDLLCRDSLNRVVCIEVAFQAGHECHNGRYNISRLEVRKSVVVCLSKKVLAEVKDSFAKDDVLSCSDKVEVLSLPRALSEDWVP